MRNRLLLIGVMLLALVLAACTGGPPSLKLETIGGGVRVSWSVGAKADEFVIERSTSGENGPFQVVARVDGRTNQYVDGSVQAGVTYTYRVKGLNAQGNEVGQSPVASVTAQPLNLLSNGSIESLNAQGSPVGWTTTTYAGQVTHGVGPGRDGGNALMISSTSGADASWGQTVPVKPNTQYHLSGWIRVDNVNPGNSLGAVISIHELQDVDGTKGARTTAATGTANWRYFETVFNSENNNSLTVLGLFGGWGQATGTVYFDDIALVEYVEVYVEGN